MKTVIFISNLLTLFAVGYYAVAKGLDLIIGIALMTSIISNAVNIVWVMNDGRKES